MIATTPARFLVAFIGGLSVATLLAFAAFASTVDADQTDAAAKEGPITIQQHSWETYHWARTSNPLSLKLGDNLTADWEPYLGTTSSDWSQSEVLDTTIAGGRVSSRDLKRKKCPPTSGRVEVCNALYGNTGWSGLAQIWISDGHITAGVAKMNDTYLPSTSTAKRNHVMCQEVGHTFGLGHTSEDGSSQKTCMDYAKNSTDSQHPNAHDYEQLRAIYDPTFTSTQTATARGHLDSTNTSQMSAAGKRGKYNSRAEWGKLKHRSADGKHEVYNRNFGNGVELVTFVEVEK